MFLAPYTTAPVQRANWPLLSITAFHFFDESFLPLDGKGVGEQGVVLEHEPQLVHLLLRVVVAAVPAFVVEFGLDGVQPLLGGLVYRALVDAWQKHLHWFVLERAGVGEHHVHLPV